MTDRELLEWAAKAAGYDYLSRDGYISCASPHEHVLRKWNPLVDDGDAFRLAVRLEIAVRFYDGEANAFGRDLVDHLELGIDPFATARRAIVRAAAQIGRTMV